jgi:dipeptidyl aminopeptidase/acylaminoacyl peptidase
MAKAFKAVLALIGAIAGPACAAPLTARDIAGFDRISDPRVSPDGEQAAYALSTPDLATNSFTDAIWVVGARPGGAAARRLAVSEGGARNPRWAPDGRGLYFLSDRSGSVQVWRTDRDGAAARRVTDLPLDVGSFRLSPDGQRMVLSLAVFNDCDTLQCTVRQSKAVRDRKSSAVTYDRLFVRRWNAWTDGTRNHLFALTLNAEGVAQGEPVALMAGMDADAPSRPFGGDEEYGFTRDGAAVVFASRASSQDEAWSTNTDLFEAPIDGSSAPRNLTAANLAADVQPVVSPDGAQLAYRAQTRPGSEADRYAILIKDLRSGETHEVAPGWDRSPDHIAWATDGRAILATADDMGQHRLFSIDVATGRVTALTAEGEVAGFDVGPGGAVYGHNSLSSPVELFALSAGAPSQLTHVNTERMARVELSDAEQFDFKGWNGETVHAYMIKPAGYQPGRKYPVALLIHGGPQSSFGNGWGYRWNPQVWAGWGFAVLMIDFHGSTGYGQAFTDSITGHWGDRPLVDLRQGWSAALARYPFIDAKRGCAAGASYGGYMVNWMAGVWNRPWKCLIVHDGIFDSRMLGYTTDELWFDEAEQGGVSWVASASVERFNPVNHVAEWRVPQLVIHGGADYRVPSEQGLAAFTALQRKGVPSRLVYFPDEGHLIDKPQNAIAWHDAVEAWLKRWTAE